MNHNQLVSALETDLRAIAERHLVDTMNTISKHAINVYMETGERGDHPFSDILFVFEENEITPRGLGQMELSLGFDSEVTAQVTSQGSGIIVATPLSIGRIAEIFNYSTDLDPKLVNAFNGVQHESTKKARQFHLDSRRMVNDAINASLGRTYTGE